MDASVDELTTLIKLAGSEAHRIRDYQQEIVTTKGSPANEFATLLPKNAPSSIRNAQRALLQCAIRLEQLCTDPTEYLERQAIHVSSICPEPSEVESLAY